VSGPIQHPWYRRPDWAGVLLLCLGATAAAAILDASGSDTYRFVFGPANPVATTLTISLLGVLALLLLKRYSWFSPGGGGRRGLRTAILLGAGLTVPVLIVDWLGGFPADINVPVPQSLLFYPSIAVVAELTFHALPLALVALLSTLAPFQPYRMRLIGMLTASTIEPVFQVAWGSAHSPVWANAYVGVHVYAFNLVGLYIFRRYGFLTMYVFRLAYYLVWHVTWGHIRLAVLFGT
jgi:hypothetical protein